jgi:hypothetical protein
LYGDRSGAVPTNRHARKTSGFKQRHAGAIHAPQRRKGCRGSSQTQT